MEFAFTPAVYAETYVRRTLSAEFKDVSCFPACDEREHDKRGGCGKPVSLEVRGAPGPLHAWAAFGLTSGPRAVAEGRSFSVADMRARELDCSGDSPLVPAASTTAEGGATRFTFRPHPMGWNYTRRMNGDDGKVARHALWVFLFTFDGANYTCVAAVPTPPFKVRCLQAGAIRPRAARTTRAARSVAEEDEETEEEEEDEEDAFLITAAREMRAARKAHRAATERLAAAKRQMVRAGTGEEVA